MNDYKPFIAASRMVNPQFHVMIPLRALRALSYVQRLVSFTLSLTIHTICKSQLSALIYQTYGGLSCSFSRWCCVVFRPRKLVINCEILNFEGRDLRGSFWHRPCLKLPSKIYTQLTHILSQQIKKKACGIALARMFTLSQNGYGI